MKSLNKALRQAVAARPDHYITPLVQYPADLWTRHVLVVGGVGSGKTTALLPIAERVAGRGESLIAFDAKGDFTSALPGAALIAPWDARSKAWDIARDLRAIGDIRRFAEALVPQGTDPFWSNASREILVGSILFLRQRQGQLWGWADLAAELVRPIHELKAVMDRFNPTAARLIEKPGVTAQGILSSLSAHCAPITDLARAWGDLPDSKRVSIVEWALAAPASRQIIVQAHASYPLLTKFLAQGILGALAGLASSPQLSDSFDRKLWLIADEAAQLGRAPFQEICSVGRSKGIRAVIATQDFAQLESIHGKEVVQSLISMCGTLIVGQMGPGHSAETLARALGSREVERRNVSISAPGPGSTVSYAREDLALYKPSELGTRLGKNSAGTGVVMALATGGDVYELTWPIVMRKPLRRPFVAAAWTTASVAPVAPSTPAFGAQGGAGSSAALGPSQWSSVAVKGGANAASAHAGGSPSSEEGGFDWQEPRELAGADASDPFAGLETFDDEGLSDEPSDPADNGRKDSI
ncbi:type IV secretion system DNA-binding domain-containing protein [Aquincola tertiaricarbonis]|uniref:Type IV secretion system DNA-binding domain-containing protein n=1 Tax=Aquincola tertiaricarbonis TaxID=391953 RepID=A0ABY4SB90_AQUTE|nr:type IV secretion system DNA-binding domain-containing protein [Aquincola tertiaricarbonis]URI09435.1 type IV secretion system DNA-binding domain-containing protein [Aquincola tertiaricarbonis]